MFGKVHSTWGLILIVERNRSVGRLSPPPSNTPIPPFLTTTWLPVGMHSFGVREVDWGWLGGGAAQPPPIDLFQLEGRNKLPDAPIWNPGSTSSKSCGKTCDGRKVREKVTP
jgi:hypothetical protein